MKKAEYLTPVVTIFDRVGNIDQKGNEMVYDFLIKGGVDGIVSSTLLYPTSKAKLNA